MRPCENRPLLASWLGIPVRSVASIVLLHSRVPPLFTLNTCNVNQFTYFLLYFWLADVDISSITRIAEFVNSAIQITII